MGVLANMVTAAQPALFGDGCNGAGTVGSTWKWKFIGMTDSTGAIVNLTTVTGTCVITDGVGGATVVTPVFAGASDGSFTITVDETVTAAIAVGTADARRCVWRLSITDTTDIVQVWGPRSSNFLVLPGA